MKFYDIRDNQHKWKAFNFIVGGRGIGKTYSALSFMLIEGRGKFLYLRNYENQLADCCTDLANPFRKLADDTCRFIYMKRKGSFANIFEDTDDGTELIGMGAYASRYEKLKGMDLSWLDYILFDEFIESRSFNFDQADAVKSIQETANRNRELQGRPPVYMFLLSNAEKLNNPTLRDFGLIPVIESMRKTGQTEWNNKHIHLELPKSEISDLKAGTALYEALDDNDSYKQVALSNDFANDSFYAINKKNINEYKPFLCVNNMYIYKHKNEARYYVCSIKASYIKRLNTKDQMLTFRSQFAKIFAILIAKDLIDYESFVIKSEFEQLVLGI